MFTIISNFSLQRNSEWFKWFCCRLDFDERKQMGVKTLIGGNRSERKGEREWCKTALFRNHSPEQYSFIMETFTCEIELFSFNDPPIVWFFWSVYKARNNHTWSLLLTAQHNKSRESRLIRKPSVTQVVERYFHRMHCESWWNFLSKGRRGVEEIWNCRRSWSILMRLFLTFFLFSFLCRSRGQLCLHIMSV